GLPVGEIRPDPRSGHFTYSGRALASDKRAFTEARQLQLTTPDTFSPGRPTETSGKQFTGSRVRGLTLSPRSGYRDRRGCCTPLELWYLRGCAVVYVLRRSRLRATRSRLKREKAAPE